MNLYSKFLTINLLFFFFSVAWADTINESVIFSEKKFSGAAGCFEVTGEYYCDKSVPTYSEDGSLRAVSEKIIGACVQGGGDCISVSFALDVKELNDNNILAKVQAQSGKEVWVKYKKDAFKSVDQWRPDLGKGSNRIIFRPQFDEIFTDRSLTKKIKLTQIADLPDGKEINHAKEDIEYIQISTFDLDKKKIIEIQVNLILKDPKLMEIDEFEAIEKGQRVPLRKIYFPANDSKGRPTYWYQPQSC